MMGVVGVQNSRCNLNIPLEFSECSCSSWSVRVYVCVRPCVRPSVCRGAFVRVYRCAFVCSVLDLKKKTQF